jgi:hypothetical protein
VLQLLQLSITAQTLEGSFSHFLKGDGQSKTTKELSLGGITFASEQNSKIHILKN